MASIRHMAEITPLKIEITRSGLTVGRLAVLSGVSERTIHRLSRTVDTRPHRPTARALATVLDVPVNVLWPGFEEKAAA